MREVTVRLPGGQYKVLIGAHVFDDLPQLMQLPADVQKIVMVEDLKAGELYGDRVAAALGKEAEVHRLTLKQGEHTKSLKAVGTLLEQMAGRRIRRTDLVVTLGGGVVTDIGGFAASVYQRGITVCHLPTTLMAQVDAAIGGKTGVNLTAGKNLVGTFHQPLSVISDVATLQSLPARQFRSGMAEVIKYALAFDQELAGVLQSQNVLPGNEVRLEQVVARCAEIKSRVVQTDERDLIGVRAALNYGHTIGHALEAFHGFDSILHGEAVSVGMVFAAELAGVLGMLDEDAIGIHRLMLGQAGLPTQTSVDLQDIRRFLEIDKKHHSSLRWVLLDGLFNAKVVEDVAWKDLETAFRKVRA